MRSGILRRGTAAVPAPAAPTPLPGRPEEGCMIARPVVARWGAGLPLWAMGMRAEVEACRACARAFWASSSALSPVSLLGS